MSYQPSYNRAYEQNRAINRAKEDKERYELLKSLGICPVCKKSDAEPGRVRCGPCTERQNRTKREYRAIYNQRVAV